MGPLADSMVTNVTPPVGQIDVHAQKTLQPWKWNFGGSVSQGAVNKKILLEGSLQCTNCYGEFSMSVGMSLRTRWGRLSSASVYAQGAGHISVQATGSVNVQPTLYSKEWEIATVSSPPVCFVLGVVPTCIDLTVPITVRPASCSVCVVVSCYIV
jgi:hypothetical protein